MQCSRYVAPKPTSSSPALSQLPMRVSKAQGGFLWITGVDILLVAPITLVMRRA